MIFHRLFPSTCITGSVIFLVPSHDWCAVRLEPAQPNTEVPFMYRSMQRELSVMCPSCHKPVIKNSRYLQCSDCSNNCSSKLNLLTRFGLTMLELIEQHAKFTALDDNMFDATEELLSQVLLHG